VFDTLIASKAARPGARTWASGALVALLHTIVITAAIWATRREGAARRSPDMVIIEHWPDEPAAPRDPGPVTSASLPSPPDLSLAGLPDLPDLKLGPDPGAPVLSVPVQPSGVPFQPGSGTSALPVALVEERPELLSAPVPPYPEALRRLGIAGRVMVDVVVDTLGRVEPASFTVVQTAHPGLVEPVRQALGRALFRPARVHGRPVRVLVRIPFEFRISR
jgi:TonB family protein